MTLLQLCVLCRGEDKIGDKVMLSVAESEVFRQELQQQKAAALRELTAKARKL